MSRHRPYRTTLALFALMLAAAGCAVPTSDPAASNSLVPGEAGAGGGAGQDPQTGAGFNLGGAGGSSNFQKVPVRSLAGLVSITFYERTGGTEPTAYTFDVNGPELTTRLPDPLDEDNHDIPGAPTEYYDVYYSDANGVFDPNGSYLTISGVFGQTAPLGGGLNLAEIGLNFSGHPTEFGNYVASFVTHGDNQDPSSVDYCIDGDLQTNTTMGNTVGTNERLRLTLGFLSSSGPAVVK